MRAPTDHETAVLDALVRRARPIILEHFTPDSCIASTKIALEALAYFGIPAREYPLLIAVFNAEAVAMLTAGKTLEDLAAHIATLSVQTPGGPWTMGIGMSAPTGADLRRWSGHLIVGAPHIGVVADLSADQATRPHKALDLEPFWAQVQDPDWFTDPQAQHMIEREDGVVMLLDRAAVGDRDGYKASPNWRGRSTSAGGFTFKPIVGRVIKAMREDLGQ